ncbi:Hypp4867 [Branchiostoma lanceolatum]|uniref:Hypp4867 protein n=1 Tax=Branchiostoma lanceolatum TaxID=7740 RepID=A0A8K0F306_BRALA|nr:Hypp4867 [Branchiostoma lanceolatum]
MLCLSLFSAGLVLLASSGLVQVSALSCYHCSDYTEEYTEYGEILNAPPTCDVMFLVTCAEHEDGCILGIEHHFSENGTTRKLERRQCSAYSNCKTSQLLYHNNTNLAYFQQVLGKNFTIDIHCCQDDGCNDVAGVTMETSVAMATRNSTATVTRESKMLLLVTVIAVTLK